MSLTDWQVKKSSNAWHVSEDISMVHFNGHGIGLEAPRALLTTATVPSDGQMGRDAAQNSHW